MRKLIALFIFAACAAPQEKFTSYGDEITSNDAVSTADLIRVVTEDETSYKVKGVIEEVCQIKGCWMTLRNETGANIRVTFKDYGFFVPIDISGTEVIIEGLAAKEILDEDVARHYAEDGGKEYDESMRSTISFVAHGVLVKEAS